MGACRLQLHGKGCEWDGKEAGQIISTHYQCFYLCHSLCAPSQHLFFLPTSELPPSPGTTATYRHSWFTGHYFLWNVRTSKDQNLLWHLIKVQTMKGPATSRVFPDESTSTQRRHLQTVGESPRQDEILIGPAEVMGACANCAPVSDRNKRDILPCQSWTHRQENTLTPSNCLAPLWGQGTINSFGNTQLE